MRVEGEPGRRDNRTPSLGSTGVLAAGLDPGEVVAEWMSDENAGKLNDYHQAQQDHVHRVMEESRQAVEAYWNNLDNLQTRLKQVLDWGENWGLSPENCWIEVGRGDVVMRRSGEWFCVYRFGWGQDNRNW